MNVGRVSRVHAYIRFIAFSNFNERHTIVLHFICNHGQHENARLGGKWRRQIAKGHSYRRYSWRSTCEIVSSKPSRDTKYPMKPSESLVIRFDFRFPDILAKENEEHAKSDRDSWLRADDDRQPQSPKVRRSIFDRGRS